MRGREGECDGVRVIGCEGIELVYLGGCSQSWRAEEGGRESVMG